MSDRMLGNIGTASESKRVTTHGIINNNSDIEIENYNGFIKIKNIDDGEIILKFGPTLLQWISFIISLVSILIIYFLTKQDGNDAIYKERK